MKLLFKWLICAGALAVTAVAFPANAYLLGAGAIAAGGTILFALNLVLKPLLQLICLPATLLTFGLFFFVVNVWMVSLTDVMLPIMRFEGFWVKLFAALLISLGNTALAGARRTRS